MTTKKQPMDTAPTNGTLVLILRHTYGWSTSGHKYIKTGAQWVECSFVDDKWRVWCGNSRTSSTDYVDPIAWAPLPE